MAFSVFGKKNESDLRKQAKKDYELAINLPSETRSDRAFKVKVALRSRAHLDKTFIHGAKISEAYHDAVLAAAANGQKKPDLPKPPPYQSIKSGGTSILTFVPDTYATSVLRYGMRYQIMDVNAEHAIKAVQTIMDSILTDLDVKHPLTALGFLREEIGEETDPGADWGNLT